jgi:hypothetical protein
MSRISVIVVVIEEVYMDIAFDVDGVVPLLAPDAGGVVLFASIPIKLLVTLILLLPLGATFVIATVVAVIVLDVAVYSRA